ncbi:hypothetical protein HCY74_06525 [Limosilactobacillus fermentum]
MVFEQFIIIFDITFVKDCLNVGKWGQILGLKAPHGERGRYGYWQGERYYYNEDALQIFLDHCDDIRDDEDY